LSVVLKQRDYFLRAVVMAVQIVVSITITSGVISCSFGWNVVKIIDRVEYQVIKTMGMRVLQEKLHGCSFEDFIFVKCKMKIEIRESEDILPLYLYIPCFFQKVRIYRQYKPILAI
jgi:hypothetical protein